MRTNLSLSDLIEGVLQEIARFRLCPELNRQYERTYARVKRFASRTNTGVYSTDLVQRFLADVTHRNETGAIASARRNHLRRAVLLLRDFAETGTLVWRPYGDLRRAVPKSSTFFSLYSQYLDSRISERWSKNTIESSRNLVGQFLVFLENNGLEDLQEARPEVVPLFFRHLMPAYSPTSIRTVASHIRAFLAFAEGGDQLLRLVPSRCPKGRTIISILTETERLALKRVLHSEDLSFRGKAIIGLALQTGLRSVDIVGMKLSDIDWIGDTISITQSKTGRPLNIPLTADVGNALSSYILSERPRSDSPHVFLRSMAPFGPLNGHSSCYAVVRNAFARAGIRLGDERKGIHLLRHSAASRMLSRGVPVTTISSMLGHVNKNSTDVYLATDERRMRECGLPLSGIPMNCGGLR
jgi:integrase